MRFQILHHTKLVIGNETYLEGCTVLIFNKTSRYMDFVHGTPDEVRKGCIKTMGYTEAPRFLFDDQIIVTREG